MNNNINSDKNIISFCGDLHKRNPPPLPSNSAMGIVVGDIGYGGKIYNLNANGEYNPHNYTLYERLSGGWKSIRGNHDNPLYAKDDPAYLGEYGYIPEYELFYLSGAWSIDWESRKIFENEELSERELQSAVELYMQKKPKILVAHELPYPIVAPMLKNRGNHPLFGCQSIRTRTNTALELMIQNHAPKYMIAGHYHTSFRAIDQNTKTKYVVLDIGEVLHIELSELKQ